MAQLTAEQRKALPDSAFAGPDRSFPIHDRTHARAALRLVGRAYAAGHITLAQKQHIIARAKRKLGEDQ